MALEQQAQQANKPRGFGAWLSNSAQKGRDLAAAGLNRLRGAFGAEQTAAVEDAEISYENLPKEMQLAGAIGFEKPDGLDFARLPDSFRAIALRVPKDQEARVRDAMESKLAIACSTTFGGNPDSTTSQLTYVTSAENVAFIRQTLHMLSVNGILVEAESQPLMARTARGEVMPLCNFRLPDLSQKQSHDLEVHSFGEGREGLERRGISMRGGLTSNHVDLSPASEASGAAAVKAYRKMSAEHTSKVPPVGPNSYILIDTTYFEGKSPDDPNVQRLKARLRLLDVPPTTIVTQIDGKIFVGSGSAKGASSVLKFADEMSEELGGGIAGFIHKGDLASSGQDKYHITGFPDTSAGSELSRLLRSSPGLRLSKELADLWSPSSTSRESTVCQIETEPIEGTSAFLNLKRCIDKLSFYRGGPRTCVGQREVIDPMVSVLKSLKRHDHEVRVIDITGTGGSGKSRTFMQALKESKVYGVLTMSEDFASGQKYHTIVKNVAQMSAQFSEDAALSVHPAIKALAEFNAEPLEERLRVAAHPAESQELIQKIVSAYEACADVKGNTAAVFDDFHCADVESARLLADLMEKLVASDSSIVVVPMHRLGEENCPEALNTLFRNVRNSGVKILEVAVRGLQLRNPKTASEYVNNMEFEYRGARVTLLDLGKRAAEGWCARLGALANTNPLRMNDLLALMLTEERLELDKGAFVELTREGEETLDSWEQVGTEGVAGEDFKIVGRDFYEKLKNPNSKRILQCMSLLRGVATLGQIKLIAREVLDIPKGQIDEAIAELKRRDCLLEVPLEDGKGTTADDKQYQIRSKPLSDYADQAVDPTLRASLNSELFSRGLGDVFTLGKDIAGSEIARPECGDKFWKDFGEAARAKFSGAEARNDVNNAYLYADSIMEVPLFGQLIEAARQGALPKVESVHKLAVEVILTRARNAFYTGRFEVSKDAMTILEEIEANNKGLVTAEMLTEIHLINFNRACALSGYGEAKAIYEEENKLNKGARLSEEDKIVCELRLANKKGEDTGDFSEAQALYEEHELFLAALNEQYATDHDGHPSPAANEAFRLNLRAREGKTKSEMNSRIELKGVDEILASATLDDGQKKQLFGEMLRAMRERGIPVEADDQILTGEQPLTKEQIHAMFVAINGALLAKNGITDDQLRYSLGSEQEIKRMFANTCKALKNREFDNTMAMQPGVLGIPQAQDQLDVLEQLNNLLSDHVQHPRSLDGFGEIAAREQRARTLARLGDHHKALKEFKEVRRLADLLNLKKFSALTAKAIGDLHLVMASVGVARPLSKHLLSTTVSQLPSFDGTHLSNAHDYYRIGIESAGELQDPYLQLAMRGEDLRQYSMKCMNFLQEFERVQGNPALVENLKGRATTAVMDGMKLFGTINAEHNDFGNRIKDKVEARYCIGGDVHPIIDLGKKLGIIKPQDLITLADTAAYPYLANEELDVGIWNASRMTDAGPGEGAQKGLGLVKRRYENLQSLRKMMSFLRPKPQSSQAQ